MASPYPLRDEHTDRMFRHLTRTSRAAGHAYSGTDPDHTVAQGWGADSIVCALAVARIADQGHCATQDAVSRIAGMSRGTAGRNLNRMVAAGRGGPIELFDARNSRCGDSAHVRSNHYRPAV